MKIKSLFFATILFSLLSLQTNAATYVVTNLNDSGPGSLREAIATANSTPLDDTITFTIPNCPNQVCRITLTSGGFVITSSSSSGALTISNASGAASLIISGNNASGIFDTSGSNPITLDGLTMADGAGAAGGAIYNRGNLTVSNSVIRNNQAVFGGGIFNRGVDASVPFFNVGTVAVIRSEIRDNVARGDLDFPQSFGGGIYADDASFLLIRDSIIAGNSAGTQGGGIGLSSYEYGPWTAVVANSTISGNTSGYGGGIDASGPGFYGTLSVTNSTITMNNGWGVSVSISTLFVRNSIIAENTPANIRNDFGIFSDLGNNLIGGSPMLGPLANNGGPTRTHALLPGSPAINAGNNCVLTANGCGDGNPVLTTDQRGFTRIGTVDIGAFEFAAQAPLFEVAGRVTTSVGHSVQPTRLELDDGNGNVRFALANPFGYFRFQHVAAGTYTVTVRSKRQGSASSTITVTSPITNLDLIL